MSEHPYERDSSARINITSEPPCYNEVPGVVPPHQGVTQTAPPSYETVMDPEAPPPEYNSLFGKVIEARRSSKNVFTFLSQLNVILLGTIGCTIILAISIIVLLVAMIVIGSVYINECPIEPYIPIYLIVGGVFGLLQNIIGLYNDHSARKQRRERRTTETPKKKGSLETILNWFSFAWFIAGCVWVYGNYEPNYDDMLSPLYCNKTLFLFSFWLFNTFFIYILLIFTVLTLFAVIACLF